MQQSINTIESQIERMEKRFTNEEQSLKERFARLETLLAQYNTTSQYLSIQLESLTNKLSSNESS